MTVKIQPFNFLYIKKGKKNGAWKHTHKLFRYENFTVRTDLAGVFLIRTRVSAFYFIMVNRPLVEANLNDRLLNEEMQHNQKWKMKRCKRTTRRSKVHRPMRQLYLINFSYYCFSKHLPSRGVSSWCPQLGGGKGIKIHLVRRQRESQTNQYMGIDKIHRNTEQNCPQVKTLNMEGFPA